MKALYKPYVYFIHLLIYIGVFPFVILLATLMVLAMLADDLAMIYRTPLKDKLPRRSWADPFRYAWPKMREVVGKVFE